MNHFIPSYYKEQRRSDEKIFYRTVVNARCRRGPGCCDLQPLDLGVAPSRERLCDRSVGDSDRPIVGEEEGAEVLTKVASCQPGEEAQAGVVIQLGRRYYRSVVVG